MYKLIIIGLMIIVPNVIGAAGDPEVQFITLGTAGGPQANNQRAHPANALVVDDKVWLVDAGDGVASQLGKAGLGLAQVQGVILSHLHFDHTGGMLAVLGLRAQMAINGNFTVYGPPGTRRFVDGLVTAMEPAMQAGFGLQGQRWQSSLKVEEITDGSEFRIDGVEITTVENSHYQAAVDAQGQPGFVSLSFRFDAPGRSIVYTGDTGPSDAVTRLAADADLLVIEMMDGPAVLDNIRRVNPALSDNVLRGLDQHFTLHHLSPEQVAKLAAAASVKAVVVTHFMPGANSPEQAAHYRALMQPYYNGEITFASDNDRF